MDKRDIEHAMRRRKRIDRVVITMLAAVLTVVGCWIGWAISEGALLWIWP